jgi:hypothetical protein
MPTKRLMSVVDAAGYAMAPTDDLFAIAAAEFQPEMALRNGHQSAARVLPKAPAEPSPVILHLEAWAHWLRDLFGPRWGAAA